MTQLLNYAEENTDEDNYRVKLYSRYSLRCILSHPDEARDDVVMGIISDRNVASGASQTEKRDGCV